MTRRFSHPFAIGGFAVAAFTAGLVSAGILDLPIRSVAQEPAEPRTVVSRHNGGGNPAAAVGPGLSDLSEALASVAEKVKPSVVYIRARGRSEERQRPPLQVPPGFERFFPNLPEEEDPSGRRVRGSW